MKILIVDDNIAIQEVLKEVVTDAGHIADAASTVDNALSSVNSFHPDIIILDIDMRDVQGLILLDRMQNSTPRIDIPVIIVRSWNRPIPQDISMVAGHVEKPFTTKEILENINMVRAGDDVTDNASNNIAVSPVTTDPEGHKKTLSDRGLSFGRSYVFFQGNQSGIYDLISAFGNEGCEVLIVTTGNKKKITKRFIKKNVKVLMLTIRMFGGHFNIYSLGTMIDDVEEFIRNSDRPVIAFDDLNKIIDRNGMNSALTAVHQLVSRKYDGDRTFLVSVDPKNFTTKDKEILLNHMTQIGE